MFCFLSEFRKVLPLIPELGGLKVLEVDEAAWALFGRALFLNPEHVDANLVNLLLDALDVLGACLLAALHPRGELGKVGLDLSDL